MPVTSSNRRFPIRAGGLMLCTFLLLAACSANKVSPATLVLQSELETRELQLQKHQVALEKRRELLEKRAARVRTENKRNQSEFTRLSEKERSLKQQQAAVEVEQSRKSASATKTSSSAEKAVSNKVLLGATEKVFVHPPDTMLTGRADTGAKRCILGVFDLAEFERDGEPHVRFSILPEKDAKKIEVTRPIKSHVRFAELNSNGKKRPMVLLRVALGDIDEQVEVVLMEDNKAEKSALSIGRNLLRDLAVVDVSKNMLIKAEAE